MDTRASSALALFAQGDGNGYNGTEGSDDRRQLHDHFHDEDSLSGKGSPRQGFLVQSLRLPEARWWASIVLMYLGVGATQGNSQAVSAVERPRHGDSRVRDAACGEAGAEGKEANADPR
jgi:hypothetical protein